MEENSANEEKNAIDKNKVSIFGKMLVQNRRDFVDWLSDLVSFLFFKIFIGSSYNDISEIF